MLLLGRKTCWQLKIERKAHLNRTILGTGEQGPHTQSFMSGIATRFGRNSNFCRPNLTIIKPHLISSHRSCSTTSHPTFHLQSHLLSHLVVRVSLTLTLSTIRSSSCQSKFWATFYLFSLHRLLQKPTFAVVISV